jgi:hypothetical protein
MSKTLCTLLGSFVVISAVACSNSEGDKASNASADNSPSIGSLESAIVTDAGVDAGDVDAGADAAP